MLSEKRYVRLISVGVLFAVAIFAAGAAVGIRWSREAVVPVVLVKPDIGGFTPTEGSSVGNHWSKDEVKAVVLLKPGIGDFVPREGSSVGNRWAKDEVSAVVLVEPSLGGFVPLQALSADTSEASIASPPAVAGVSTAPVVESTVDGDFEGWEGETVIKLSNGQIWQQEEYFYEYHYAYMPKVIVYRAGNGFKMRVDGVSRPVGVKRLR